MLARHGYGVLLFDRRGEGRSEGQPNAFGWGGDRDIKGAIEFLKARGIDRIGGLGLSVGGELMLEAAAETDELDAVVSEGAGARAMGEAIDDPALPGRDRPLAALQNGFKDLAMAVSANELPPKHLKGLVKQIEQPTLLIAAPNTHERREAQPRLRQGHQGDAVGDPRVQARAGDQGPAGRVREARRRLLRPGPLNAKTPAAQTCRGRPLATS